MFGDRNAESTGEKCWKVSAEFTIVGVTYSYVTEIALVNKQ